jgi:hypothetical protein
MDLKRNKEQEMSKMDLSIPEKILKEIESSIGSDESVVGIDAKKTHVIIIHMLHQIQESLNDLEARIEKLEK